MSTDIELLESAARAAGLPWDQWVINGDDSWNSLECHGDAMELAVILGLSVEPYPLYTWPKHSVIVKQRRRTDQLREANPTEVVELYGDNPIAATCRAITRSAAASLGSDVKGG